jgi:hypothetical protein
VCHTCGQCLTAYLRYLSARHLNFGVLHPFAVPLHLYGVLHPFAVLHHLYGVLHHLYGVRLIHAGNRWHAKR